MAKSRTSNKTKSKKSKFPMWGIAIIVVAVVVVAGYAIIRFSQAGTGTAYKKPGTGMSCLGGAYKTDKGGGGGASCTLKNLGNYASATWTQFEQGTNSVECATVSFGNNSKVAIRWKATGDNVIPFYSDYESNWYTISGNNVKKAVCTPSKSNDQKVRWQAKSNTTLEVKNVGGSSGVINMYVTQ